MILTQTAVVVATAGATMLGLRHQRKLSEEVGPNVVETDPKGRYIRYDVLLGRGACKRVYKGFDTHDGIEVAWNQVELLGADLEEDEMRHRLFEEIRVLQQLKHKNIISFRDWWFDKHSNTINFITELFTSGTLRQYRKRVKLVSEQMLKRWGHQILEGLLYLHGHMPPIVHRDLKCDNIFINGTSGQVKIGDLGLATAQQGMSVVGTPEYMAPEIYDEEYNEKVDIYSFGMCMLELATLEYPYSECHGVAQIFKKVTTGVKPAALARVSNTQLREFIELCLQTCPQQRPSARQLLKHPYLDSLRNDIHISPSASSLNLARHSMGTCTSGQRSVPQSMYPGCMADLRAELHYRECLARAQQTVLASKCDASNLQQCSYSCAVSAAAVCASAMASQPTAAHAAMATVSAFASAPTTLLTEHAACVAAALPILALASTESARQLEMCASVQLKARRSIMSHDLQLLAQVDGMMDCAPRLGTSASAESMPCADTSCLLCDDSACVGCCSDSSEEEVIIPLDILTSAVNIDDWAAGAADGDSHLRHSCSLNAALSGHTIQEDAPLEGSCFEYLNAECNSIDSSIDSSSSAHMLAASTPRRRGSQAPSVRSSLASSNSLPPGQRLRTLRSMRLDTALQRVPPLAPGSPKHASQRRLAVQRTSSDAAALLPETSSSGSGQSNSSTSTTDGLGQVNAASWNGEQREVSRPIQGVIVRVKQCHQDWSLASRLRRAMTL